MDTVVLVSAFRSSGGSSYQLLQLARERSFGMLSTPALFLEYEEVLSRPEQRAIHGLGGKQLDSVLHDLAALIVPVEVHFKWRPQLADADDEMVLEAAVNGGADCIVTYNLKDFADVSRNFKLRILTPAQAIKEIKR